MGVWDFLRSRHYYPHYVYFDEQFLLSVFSDITGQLPKEIEKSKGLNLKFVDWGGVKRATFKRNAYFEGVIEKLKIHNDEIFELSDNASLDEGFACLVDDISFNYDGEKEYTLVLMNGKNFYLRTDSFECPEIKINKKNMPLGDKGEKFLIIGVNERVISIISLDKSFKLDVTLKGELPLDKIIDKVWKDNKKKK